MGIALADVKYRTHQRIAYICVYILNVKNANIDGRKEHLNVNGFNLFIYIYTFPQYQVNCCPPNLILIYFRHVQPRYYGTVLQAIRNSFIQHIVSNPCILFTRTFQDTSHSCGLYEWNCT